MWSLDLKELARPEADVSSAASGLALSSTDKKMAEGHFEEGGSAYARHRPSYPDALADFLAGAVLGDAHALDVGCGTGQLSVLLGDRFERVTAIDPSASQLAYATPHLRVQYRAATAEDVGLADGSVDLVVAAQAAHWFDLPSFYAEARRVARPGATIALVTYGVPTVTGPAASCFDDFYWRRIHGHWRPGRRHVETAYLDLPFPFAEKPLPPFAIERTWTVDALL
ncbi:MAG: class I SAM-dependent methyltransferase, partial [Myxococcota bacterium]